MAAIIVVIPAFNEEDSIGLVLKAIPKGLVSEVVVVNNGSTDRTAEVARNAGAKVIDQPARGYGNACLKGMEYLEKLSEEPEIIVFLDGDYSDHPEEMYDVIKPIKDGKYDMVIGSRALGEREAGAMLPQAVFGNWLATKLLKLFHGAKFTDLGPFRAIRYEKLKALNMADKNFGWTVEMQVKAARNGTTWCEVPVKYRKRIGKSKVTGTVKGSIMAGYKILYTIFKYSL